MLALPLSSIPQQGSPSGLQISPDVLAKAQETLKACSWEELEAVYRSDDRRNYKITISTDALNEDDDNEYREQVLSFGQTIVEMMKEIVPALDSNPSLAAFSKELVMATVKAFKVGRPLEEALQDGLDQLQNQPPQQPAPDPATIKAQAEVEKAKSEAQIAQLRLQQEQQKLQVDTANSQQDRALSSQQNQTEAQLKLTDIQLKHQREMAALQIQQEQLELNKYNILLALKKLGISSRAQALEEFAASGNAQDMHERRAADIRNQDAATLLQAHAQSRVPGSVG